VLCVSGKKYLNSNLENFFIAASGIEVNDFSFIPVMLIFRSNHPSLFHSVRLLHF